MTNTQNAPHNKSRALLKLREVMERVPYSQSSIYRLMHEGKFPQNVKIGEHAVAWRESDINDFIDGLGA